MSTVVTTQNKRHVVTGSKKRCNQVDRGNYPVIKSLSSNDPTPLTHFGSNLKTWWNLDRSVVTLVSGNVSNISDLSGNSKPLLQANTLTQPLLVTADLNEKDVMRFDGVAEFMKEVSVGSYYNFLHDGTGGTMIIVFKMEDANPDKIQDILTTTDFNGGYAGHFMVGDDRSAQSRSNRLGTNVANNSSIPWNTLATGVDEACPPQTWDWFASEFSSDLLRNINATGVYDSDSGSGTEGTNNADGIRVAWRGLLTNYSSISVAEIFTVDRVLDSDDQVFLSDYFASEWGL